MTEEQDPEHEKKSLDIEALLKREPDDILIGRYRDAKQAYDNLYRKVQPRTDAQRSERNRELNRLERKMNQAERELAAFLLARENNERASEKEED